MQIHRNPTRSVRIGTVTIGGGQPIAVQSMTATQTRDIDATVAQVNALSAAGADVVRIAVDSPAEAAAMPEIRRQTKANLVVDLQENYRLAERIAPYVDKLRYNPGHLYHHEREKPWQDKVRYLVQIARDHDCALRVGVNCGSVDPAQQAKYDPKDKLSPMLDSALDHCRLLDEIDFTRYCVSLKDSDPRDVIEVNRRFAEARPDVPLHLGVTEAGLPPDGIIKRGSPSSSSSVAASATRFAFRSPFPTIASRRKSPPAARFLRTSRWGASDPLWTTGFRRSTSLAAQAARESKTRRSSSWPRR
jgi:(E)-4-hydroxy-3-methylbut-2-enyl-diphosphate synthase